MSESLKHNTSLTELNLGGNEMKRKDTRGEKRRRSTDNNIGPKGAESVSESLKINTSLTKLRLACDENK